MPHTESLRSVHSTKYRDVAMKVETARRGEKSGTTERIIKVHTPA